MKSIFGAGLAVFALYSMLTNGREIQVSSDQIRAIRDDTKTARSLVAKLRACREETFQYCADQTMPDEIVGCLRRNFGSLSERCAETVETLK